MKKIFIIIILFLSVSTINSTTWGSKKIRCPICKSNNSYNEIISYGSYIYHWPSKFQIVYWPLIDANSIYCCVDCYYSAFMWDFKTVPEDKIEPIKQFLKKFEDVKKPNNYLDVDVIDRLKIAEKIYEIIGKDDQFFSLFYRVLGYHYISKKDEFDAANSRLKAIQYTHKILTDTTLNGMLKENLYILGAMHYFTGNKDSARIYLEKARPLKYTLGKDEKENQGNDDYLNKLIDEVLKIIPLDSVDLEDRYGND